MSVSASMVRQAHRSGDAELLDGCVLGERSTWPDDAGARSDSGSAVGTYDWLIAAMLRDARNRAQAAGLAIEHAPSCFTELRAVDSEPVGLGTADGVAHVDFDRPARNLFVREVEGR